VPSSSLMPDSPNLPLHQRGHEPIRPHFPRPATLPLQARPRRDTQKCIRAGANTTTSKTSASTPTTTPSSKCSQLVLRRLLQNAKPSTGPGNSSPAFGNFQKIRLYATVYCPAMERTDGFRWSFDRSTLIAFAKGELANLNTADYEDKLDVEAFLHWRDYFLKDNLDPAVQIVPGNKKTTSG